MSLVSLPTPCSVDAVSFAPDGATIAASAGSELLLTPSDASGTARVFPLPFDKGDVATALSFSPSGDRIAIAFEKGGVVIVDAFSGSVVALPSPASHVSLAWSPDGRWLVGGQVDPWLTIFDVELRAERCVLDPDLFDDSGRTGVAFAGDTLLSTAANKVCVWPFARIADAKLRTRDEPIGKVAVVRPKKIGRDGFRHLMALALAPDGSQVALLEDTESETAICRLDLLTGKSIGRALPIDGGLQLAWTGLPNIVAVGSDDRGIALFDLEARRALERTFDGEDSFVVRALATHPATRRLAAATTAGLRIWNLDSAD